MEHCKILLGKPLEMCLLERQRKTCRYCLRMNIRDEKARDRPSGSRLCSVKIFSRPLSFVTWNSYVLDMSVKDWIINGDVIRTVYQSLLYSEYLIQFCSNA
jgi:hypothetical protein